MGKRSWNCLPEREACKQARIAFITFADELQQLQHAQANSNEPLFDQSFLDENFDLVIELGLHLLNMQMRYYAPIVPPSNRQKAPIRIEHLSEMQAITHFRFRKCALQSMLGCLWPKFEEVSGATSSEAITCQYGYSVPFETGMLYMLYRLAHRGTLGDMEVVFGVGNSKLSAVILTFCGHFHDIARPYFDNMQTFAHRFEMYADYVERATDGIVDNVVGFIDGTLRKTCRPHIYQEFAYSGHKRCHGIKYQGVSAPDGLMMHFYGPIAGNRHDGFMLKESRIEEQMEDMMPLDGPNKIYRLYGDPAYANRVYVFGGFSNVVRGSPEAIVNREMSAVRICVEWQFKEIVKLFPLLDVTKLMRIYGSPLTHMYYTAAFFMNLHCTVYGNQQSARYDLNKMSMEEYLLLVP